MIFRDFFRASGQTGGPDFRYYAQSISVVLKKKRGKIELSIGGSRKRGYGMNKNRIRVVFMGMGLMAAVLGLMLLTSCGKDEGESLTLPVVSDSPAAGTEAFGISAQEGADEGTAASEGASVASEGSEQALTKMVYVCGAVVTPGVYELPQESRIVDALIAAGGFTPEAVSNYLNQAKHYFPEHVVVHIDNSDVVKPCGRAFEGISRIRDGSKSTASKAVMGNGYYVTEATALTSSGHPVSVFSEVWSTESLTFISGGEFAYTKKVIQSCTDNLGHVTFVMDRGYDDNDVFRLLDRLGQEYVIRLKLNRKVRVNGKKCSVEELCSRHKGKYVTISRGAGCVENKL